MTEFYAKGSQVYCGGNLVCRREPAWEAEDIARLLNMGAKAEREGIDNVDFRDYPMSLAERNGKSAGDWSPREALINLLRDVDDQRAQGEAGLVPEVAVMAIKWRKPDGAVTTTFRNAAKDIHAAVGLYEVAKAYCLSKIGWND